jgi:hypothetical protein
MSKLQLRAICPACFAQQAVKNNRLVAHGYKRPQHWHSNVGTCAGAGHAHFGTEAGRYVTAQIAASLRAQATRLRTLTLDTVVVTTRKRNYGVWSTVVVDMPTDLQREVALRQARSQASQLDSQADEFERLVAAWTPVEAVPVTVEAKVTLRHLHDARLGGKLCASSRMGAQTGWCVERIEDVTCSKCLARHDMRQAKANAVSCNQ